MWVSVNEYKYARVYVYVCLCVRACMYVRKCEHMCAGPKSGIKCSLFVVSVEISNLHSHAYDKNQVINEVQNETRTSAVTQYTG